ncbi:MAG: hypothetical protein KC620_05770 [Myxococcales bacterium]|nr:hypothetical protein [Myxococcales bacterium]
MIEAPPPRTPRDVFGLLRHGSAWVRQYVLAELLARPVGRRLRPRRGPPAPATPPPDHPRL